MPDTAPLDLRPEAIDFLLTRRSRPARTLTTPVPDRAALLPMLTAAARTPDHGKLEPWRFIVLERAALVRLAGLAQARLEALDCEPEKLAKEVAQFADAHLVVAVVHVPRQSPKVPAMEQILSTGAACLALLNAALATGWGANWLTGPMATDPAFLGEGLGAAAGEFVAGFIHMGTETAAPPDRPRPDLGKIVSWVAA